MTREFNQNQRYDSRPPYRGSSSNNRYGAEQPSRPTTRPRLNRAMVDRAWENGAPHRHADYKPRHPNEAGTTQTNYGPNAQRNWRKAQPSEHSSHDHAPHERDDSKRPSRYHDAHTQPHRSDYSSNGYQGSRSRSTQPNNSFADQPPYRDQRGNGNEENTYRTRNGHPNFSHTPQEANRGRHNQESGQQASHRNGAYSYRTNPTNHVSNAGDRRDQRTRPYDQREAPHRDNRFEGRQRTNFNEPRYPSYPATPGKQRESRSNRQSEQFEGDYEQFDHAPSRQPRDGRQKEERPPQAQSRRMEKPPEVERHVTPLPDGRVLKGPRTVQRKNAQFWTDISQDTEKLVNQVQTSEETAEKVADEQTQTSALPVEQSAPTKRVVSSRAKAAKRAASAARKGKTDRPVSNGPKPSQRGFKWPSSPSQS
jgi:hypothetical protein